MTKLERIRLVFFCAGRYSGRCRRVRHHLVVPCEPDRARLYRKRRPCWRCGSKIEAGVTVGRALCVGGEEMR